MDVTEQGRAALRRACDIVGSPAALAKAIGTFGQRVDNWLKRDKAISSDFCPAIELATNGAVRCEELRPDVRWDVLRQSGHAPTPDSDSPDAWPPGGATSPIACGKEGPWPRRKEGAA